MGERRSEVRGDGLIAPGRSKGSRVQITEPGVRRRAPRGAQCGQGALEWIRPEIGAHALESAAVPAASGELSSALENPVEKVAGPVGPRCEAGPGLRPRLEERPPRAVRRHPARARRNDKSRALPHRPEQLSDENGRSNKAASPPSELATRGLEPADTKYCWIPPPTDHSTTTEVTQAPPVTRNVGSRWTAIEEDLLRSAANICWRPGLKKKDLSSMVRASIPHRTADAIAKRLTTIKWAPPSANRPPSLQLPLPPTPSHLQMPLEGPEPTTSIPLLPTPPTGSDLQITSPILSGTVDLGNDCYGGWRKKMVETILRDLREPLSHADRLKDITQSLHENRTICSCSLNIYPDCALCGEPMGTLAQLRRHTAGVHTSVLVRFMCAACGKSFPTFHPVACHVPKCRGQPVARPKGPITCEACDATFETRRGCSTHERHVHPDTRKRKRIASMRATLGPSGEAVEARTTQAPLIGNPDASTDPKRQRIEVYTDGMAPLEPDASSLIPVVTPTRPESLLKEQFRELVRDKVGAVEGDDAEDIPVLRAWLKGTDQLPALVTEATSSMLQGLTHEEKARPAPSRRKRGRVSHKRLHRQRIAGGTSPGGEPRETRPGRGQTVPIPSPDTHRKFVRVPVPIDLYTT
ncbi:hypothetical protein E1301_Tti021512 [Triplophysa tibetana]|uniref:C2H2-type domain-containing protein n=1 Tax=Triplophysa tibetana TaxID=1572043 RepID=A0A5A9MXM7_9TELE|nr:hypothetical protein E1301_Tti021512 [Triplophysa tibetana]